MKLELEHKHILKLIARDRVDGEWADVSETLCKYIKANMPVELVTFEKLDVGGRIKLTEEGQQVVNALAWL